MSFWLKMHCFSFKLFRTDTFEELGYRKMRRVSEVCSETIFQAFIQLILLIRVWEAERSGSVDNPGNVGEFSVFFSLVASVFVIVLWFGIILKIEAKSNGMAVAEYLPIVLQGSFKFVPFLPAIERGTDTGQNVNWTGYKFDLNALSALGKVCKLPIC